MNCLAPLWREWRIFILKWALRELDPQHVDVPQLVIELDHHLADRRRTAPAA